jgi:hypothetical protein
MNEESLEGAKKKEPRSGYEGAELFDEVEDPLFEDERDAEVTILQEQVAALTKQVSCKLVGGSSSIDDVDCVVSVYRCVLDAGYIHGVVD